MSTVAIETDPRGVATLTLARPEKHNAMSSEMISELHAAALSLGADPAVRAVVLTGAGRSFCAGGDLGWMREQMTADAATRAAEARKLAEMLFALNRMPKPLIGAVQGNAFGGGIGLISVCDVAVAVDTARFGLTETRLGLIPATIGPYVIACLGGAKARRVFMSARLFDAAEAVDLGLIRRTVSEDDFAAAVETEVAPYLSAAPGAVASAKALALTLDGGVTPDQIDTTISALVARWESDEAVEGIAAFFEKRTPSWGRGD